MGPLARSRPSSQAQPASVATTDTGKHGCHQLSCPGQPSDTRKKCVLVYAPELLWLLVILWVLQHYCG